MGWKANDTVVHIRDGVCTVRSVEKLTISSDEPCEYYILTPVYDPGSKIYVPVERGDAVLRALITKEEIDDLIRTIPEMGIDWISDDKQRQRALQQEVKSGSHETLLGVISTLYKKRKEIDSSGRKFHSADERFLNEAEKQIHREFGYVLGIDPDRVPEYIHAKLSGEGKNKA